MSSKLWREPAKVCSSRSSQICGTPRRTVVVLGELLCLATFVTFFGAPAKGAIGAGAIGLHTHASQIAPVERVQTTNGRKKYRWYANGWNGPGYYEVGDTWKTGVGWGNNNAGQPPPIARSGNNNAGGVAPPSPPPNPVSGNNNSPNNVANNNSTGLIDRRAVPRIPVSSAVPIRTVPVIPLHLR